MKKTVLFLLLLNFFCSAFSEYYADISITIGKDGLCKIKGITNHPLLSEGIHNELTYKEGTKWGFLLDINDKFSDFVYDIHLPPNARLTKVNNSGSISIQAEGDVITIKGFGKEEPLRLFVWYYIDNNEQRGLIGWPILAILIAVLSAFAAKYIIRKKKIAKKANEENKKNYEGLNERQRAIMIFLEEKGGKATQKEITEALRLPKSSVSRNIEALLKRGYVKKEQRGMTNFIGINAGKKET
ncbi:MAG: MarR family transcriptional regulator [Candidatus Diapherotrites archaeon]